MLTALTFSTDTPLPCHLRLRGNTPLWRDGAGSWPCRLSSSGTLEAGMFCPSSLRLERSRGISWEYEEIFSLSFQIWNQCCASWKCSPSWEASFLALGFGYKLWISASSSGPLLLPTHAQPCTPTGRQSESVCRGRRPGRGFGNGGIMNDVCLLFPEEGAGMSGSRFVHLGSHTMPTSSSNLDHFGRRGKESLDFYVKMYIRHTCMHTSLQFVPPEAPVKWQQEYLKSDKLPRMGKTKEETAETCCRGWGEGGLKEKGEWWMISAQEHKFQAVTGVSADGSQRIP